MGISLSTNVAGLSLKNPFIASSGTVGFIYDAPEIMRIGLFGGAVTKTVTLNARDGNPLPRVWETPSSIINSVGLENPGIDAFIEEHLPCLRVSEDLRVFLSVSDEDLKNLCVALERLVPHKNLFDSIELNLSCPNVRGKKMLGQSADKTKKAVQVAKSLFPQTPVFAKLTPQVTDIVKISEAAMEAGADGLVLSNTLPALALDRVTLKPALGGITGGLSGPAVKPLMLFAVYKVYKAVKCPIVASGGIFNAEDVVEALAAGAVAVQIGSANLINPGIIEKLIERLRLIIAEKNFSSVRELVGFAHQT
jgi:dihydroorotate dehydrogenase (NAD+) catalytic subunit